MKKTKYIILTVLFIFLLSACRDDGMSNVLQIIDLEPVNVNRFSDIDALALPAQVAVVFDDQATPSMINVDWTEALTALDLSELGFKTLVGALILPEGSRNQANIRPSITIEVLPISLLETLEHQPQFSMLYTAIEITGLDDILSLEGPFAIFAPTNEAFLTFFERINTTEEDFMQNENLADILLYHILAGNYSANVVIATIPGSLQTLEGTPLNFNLSGARIQVNNMSIVTQSNIKASNGWIHEVDNVLLPSTVVEDIADDLFGEGLLALFMTLLEDGAIPFELLFADSITLFAPSEEAFNQLLLDLDTTVELLLMDEDVVDLVLYHVLTGEYLAEDLYQDAPINVRTFQGTLIRVDVVEGQLMVGPAKVTGTETFGTFALVHTIDKVLIPPHIYEKWFGDNT